MSLCGHEHSAFSVLSEMKRIKLKKLSILKGAFVLKGIAAGAPDTGSRKAMRLSGEGAGG